MILILIFFLNENCCLHLIKDFNNSQEIPKLSKQSFIKQLKPIKRIKADRLDIKAKP